MAIERLSQVELTAYMALLEAGSLLQQRVDRQLKVLGGITQPQFEILANVAAVPLGLRMSDLAARAVRSASGMTYRVAQLEKRGLITRVGDDTDERSVLVRATAEGEALMAKLLPKHLALVRESFLSVLAPSDLVTLGSILASVASHLRKTDTSNDLASCDE